MSFIAPAAKASVGVFPVTVVRGQITPGSAGTQNPENGIDEAPIILSDAAPGASAPGQMRFKQGPGAIVDVVAAVCGQWLECASVR